MTFDNKPVLVFWETTRACPLACIHCRASAITEPSPQELSHSEGMGLIDQVAEFGKPSPTIIFTGGDPLKRKDLTQLLSYASSRGLNYALSPAVSELLNFETIEKIKRSGVSSISVSLDGASKETHDAIRNKEGTFRRTEEVLRNCALAGLGVQVNTAIMRRNLFELPQMFHLIRSLGVKTWELFFLIQVGRGSAVEDITPDDYESVCNFLYDASFYGMTIRTVEAPFIRRVAAQRAENDAYWKDPTYLRLRSELLRLEGPPSSATSTLARKGTLDGDGILFVSNEGKIHPGGLIPVDLGNVKSSRIPLVYRENPLLRSIRERRFNGPCGACAFKDICGGSRARAFSYNGDPLGSDPACIFSRRGI
ncbi:MAG: TIGR04053 family radical SAM/SPASM domain-containing protein [Nitrososphaerota archaeon]|nr:TIGR04053 family radical SAM/SPASM domain-containing protein [Nitrososphaerota archaeon]